MGFEHAVALLAMLSRLNPAMRVVEGMAAEWHLALSDFYPQEVLEAARKVAYEQTWVGVADIRAAVKAAHAERLSKVDINSLVQLDIDDPGWSAEYARISREVAAGIRDSRGELTQG